MRLSGRRQIAAAGGPATSDAPMARGRPARGDHHRLFHTVGIEQGIGKGEVDDAPPTSPTALTAREAPTVIGIRLRIDIGPARLRVSGIQIRAQGAVSPATARHRTSVSAMA